jgi:hypothetical protein
VACAAEKKKATPRRSFFRSAFFVLLSSSCVAVFCVLRFCVLRFCVRRQCGLRAQTPSGQPHECWLPAGRGYKLTAKASLYELYRKYFTASTSPQLQALPAD